MHTVVASNPSPAAKREMMTPIESPVGDQVIARGIDTDQEPADKTIWYWAAFFLVFILWGWAQHRSDSIRKELEPQNMQANLHNIAVITFAAIIGIVGGKVLFTKLAGLTKNVPVLGRVFGYLAQLFAAA